MEQGTEIRDICDAYIIAIFHLENDGVCLAEGCICNEICALNAFLFRLYQNHLLIL